MAKFTSGRQKDFKVGIGSYSENRTSLEVIGRVGVGTTNATSKLTVAGDTLVTGVTTTTKLNVGTGGTVLTAVNGPSRVGVNSVNPGYTLVVNGDINFNGLLYQNNQQFIASRWSAGAGTTIYRDSYVGIGTSLPTQELEVAGDVKISGAIYDALNDPGSNNEILSSNGSSGWTWKSFSELGGFTGLTVQDEGVIVGTANSVRIVNFTGTGITATASGNISTITAPKDLETLEQISEMRYQQRKLENEDEDNDIALLMQTIPDFKIPDNILLLITKDSMSLSESMDAIFPYVLHLYKIFKGATHD